MWCTASVKWWKIQRIQKVCSLKILFSWWVQIDQIEKFIILNLLFKLRDCSIAIWFFSDFLYIPSIQGWKYLSLWVAGCWLARLKWNVSNVLFYQRQSLPPEKSQGLSHWGQGQQSPYIQGPGISCFLLGAQGKNGERPNTTASL